MNNAITLLNTLTLCYWEQTNFLFTQLEESLRKSRMATSGYAHFEIQGQIEEIIDVLESRFGGCFTRCYTHNGRCVLAILLGQKYYFWMGNNEAAVSIILRAEDYLVFMEVIGFAGGYGVFRLDYGHNKDIVHDVEKHLRDNGFKITRTHFAEISENSEKAYKHYTRTEHLIPHIH